MLAGAELDPGTRGPAVDSRLRTTRAGLFACGNLLHGAETADVAALGGRHVAAGVLDRIGGGAWPARISISCEEPLRWISRARSARSRSGIGLGGATCCGRERSSAGSGSSFTQDGRVLASRRFARIMPGRSTALATGWVKRVDRGTACGRPRRLSRAKRLHHRGARRYLRRVAKRDTATEAVFKPVRPPTAFEETVERLGTAIRTGLLAPGTKLPPERKLAGELRISRSTLRQALTTLVQTGHLNSVRGRTGGTFVAASPPLHEHEEEPLGRDAWAILDRRVAIEVGATILAAERFRAPDLAALESVERMANAPEFEQYRRADIRFHIGVAEAARSPRLVTEMTEVQGQVSDLIALIPHPEQVLTFSNEQHRELVALLGAGDAVAAASLMRQHIRGTEHILRGLI